MASLTDYWEAIAPAISPDLISPESLGHLAEVGGHFPSAIASLVGFECRLADPQPQADLFLRVVPENGGRDILAGSEAVETLGKLYHLLAGSATIPVLSSGLIEHPVWRKIRLFCREWSNPDTSFYRTVNDLWLEFDLTGDLTGDLTTDRVIPVPSVFWGSEQVADLENHLNWWLDSRLTSAQSQIIHQTFQALPPTAKLFQSGVLLSRNSQALRFYIADISPTQIYGYLEQLGWLGDRYSIGAILALLSVGINKTNLQLEIDGNSLSDQIAVECYLENRQAWQIFLDGLVKTGFCLPQKRDAILSFGGLTHERDSPEKWPDTLRRRSQLLGEDWESVLFRRLAYLKLTYRRGIPLEFKAYLGVQPGWINTKSWGVKL
ncbi:MAG: hypothetical protein KFF72_02165 [Arthrospira sp. SH-MAG29]|nr:hypothetical protein [Arthrospira sp. SH-MAG29]MBS0015173.1 hypothetical protein [Arthrospira sp. SH-MAG29]